MKLSMINLGSNVNDSFIDYLTFESGKSLDTIEETST